MRILILGGGGMLGHQLAASYQSIHEIFVTVRGNREGSGLADLLSPKQVLEQVDVLDKAQLEKIFEQVKPEAVINAVGVIKQRDDASVAIPSIEINSLLPHRLSELCMQAGARLVHLSTDCVFSGEKGFYAESDVPDARDLYGRSKLLGEVTDPHTVTLRTSIIGLELRHKKSLIEWYLAQSGAIKGFTRAIYSGFTTAEMARIIERVLLQHPELNGLYQVASEPINKYQLLSCLNELLGRDDLEIVPDAEFVCDRSLNGELFKQATGYQPPSWDNMLAELGEQIKERDKALTTC